MEARLSGHSHLSVVQAQGPEPRSGLLLAAGFWFKSLAAHPLSVGTGTAIAWRGNGRTDDAGN